MFHGIWVNEENGDSAASVFAKHAAWFRARGIESEKTLEDAFEAMRGDRKRVLAVQLTASFAYNQIDRVCSGYALTVQRTDRTDAFGAPPRLVLLFMQKVADGAVKRSNVSVHDMKDVFHDIWSGMACGNTVKRITDHRDYGISVYGGPSLGGQDGTASLVFVRVCLPMICPTLAHRDGVRIEQLFTAGKISSAVEEEKQRLIMSVSHTLETVGMPAFLQENSLVDELKLIDASVDRFFVERGSEVFYTSGCRLISQATDLLWYRSTETALQIHDVDVFGQEESMGGVGEEDDEEDASTMMGKRRQRKTALLLRRIEKDYGTASLFIGYGLPAINESCVPAERQTAPKNVAREAIYTDPSVNEISDAFDSTLVYYDDGMFVSHVDAPLFATVYVAATHAPCTEISESLTWKRRTEQPAELHISFDEEGGFARLKLYINSVSEQYQDLANVHITPTGIKFQMEHLGSL